MPAISTREEEEVRVVRVGWGFLNWKLDNLAAVGLVFFLLEFINESNTERSPSRPNVRGGAIAQRHLFHIRRKRINNILFKFASRTWECDLFSATIVNYV